MSAAVIEPLARRLPTMTGGDAALARLLFSGRLATLLGEWVEGLRLSGRREGAADSAGMFGLVWSGPSAKLLVMVPEALDAATTAVVRAVGWAIPMRLACLSAILQSSLEPIDEWATALGLRLSKVLDAAALAALDVSGTTIECRWGAHRIGFQLRSSETAWVDRVLADLCGRARPRLSAVAALPVPATLAFGGRRLSANTLRTLAVGDVLLMAHRTQDPNTIDRAFLVLGPRRGRAVGLRCEIQDRTMTLLGDHWMNEQTMNEEALADREEAALPGATRDALAGIEVDLHLELQVLSLPMGELANMREGYVLELPIAAAEASVDLVVGGQVFGRAQLVCIGDRLGARIVELNHESR
jgi:type III secretion protein Q